jgi:hypothetical protein
METIVSKTTELEDAQAELKAAVADLKTKRAIAAKKEIAASQAEDAVAESGKRYREARDNLLRIGGDEDVTGRFR